MMRVWLACVAIGMVAACGDSKTGTETPAPGGGTGTGEPSVGSPDAGTPPASVDPAGSLTVTFGPIVAPPGEEHTQCVVKRLGNASALHVGTVHNVLSKGSHHLIVYRVADTEEKVTPYNCQPFADTFDPTKGAPIMITQKADDLLNLPEGIGYSLDQNQMIRLEMHYINAGAQPLSVTASSTMIPLAEGALKHEADVLLIGSTSINVPAKSTATLGPTYIRLPTAYTGVNFFAITGHEHQFGTNVTVSTAANVDAAGTPVYNVPDWSWSEPATVFANPPFVVPTGGGFKLTCDWKNTSDKALSFGESAQDEMCFFWGYYYPRKTGARVILGR